MGIKLATQEDIEWVNSQYKLAGFVPSEMKKEIIAIVTCKGKYAGIGRLVRIDEDNIEMGGIYILPSYRGEKLAGEIVSFLVKEAKKTNVANVYCLPFEELELFYKKFGFKDVNPEKDDIHETILTKYKWCLQEYEKNVLLFKL
jgi:N-acetylglutamate synthase-like GNAT family acetyltransferase